MRKYWLAAAVVVSTFTIVAAIMIAVDIVNQTISGRMKAAASLTSPQSYPLSPISVPLDVAGVSHPTLVSAEESGLQDDDIIIGVEAFGESRAYLRIAFDNNPARHVVNDRIASIPVTITHCDITRCTRVLTSGKANEAVDIRCGGMFALHGMDLLVGEQRYPQSSADIPLIDLPFVVSTWKKWRQEHPNSKVYLGEALKRENTSQKMPGKESK